MKKSLLVLGGTLVIGLGVTLAWRRADIFHKSARTPRQVVASSSGKAELLATPNLRYEPQAIGAPVSEFGRPLVTNLTLADLDKDGLLDVIYCEAQRNSVRWIRQAPRGVFTERIIAENVPGPAHVAAADVNGTGRLDVLVASMGQITPNNDLIGSVVVLENLDNERFAKHVVLDHVARVSDVEAGRLVNHADGRLDLVVGQFGYAQGETRWLENKGDWHFESHVVNRQSGCIHAPVADFNGDGRTDFAALISQEWEEVHWFENRGDGNFADTLVWGSTNEDYGSSGLVVADVNRDGRPDLLYTNGDQFDYSVQGVRPWHGLQWIENRGGGAFTFHRVGDFSKAYGPCAADLNGDGYVDLVAVSGFSNEKGPDGEGSVSLMAWLNDGRENFTPVAIARRPVQLITAAVGDLDGNGIPVIVTGGFCSVPPFENMSNVTLWRRAMDGAERVVVAHESHEEHETHEILKPQQPRQSAPGTNKTQSASGEINPGKTDVFPVAQEKIERAEKDVGKTNRAPAALAELARLYQENGYEAKAAAIWEELIRLQPKEARWTYYLADLRLNADDRAAAARWLKKTLELDPSYAPGWLKLADLEFKTGEFRAAAEHYRRRLEFVPKDPYARLGLFRVLRAHETDDSSRGLGGASGSAGTPRPTLGSTSGYDGTDDKRRLLEIIRDTPQFSPAHNFYAEILDAEGDHDGALMERWIGRETGRFRDADDPWLTELHDWCFDPHRLLVLGTIEFQTGRNQDALKYLQRAESLSGGDPSMAEAIGSLYLKIGDTARARATLERGIARAEAGPNAPAAGLYVTSSEVFRATHEPDNALRAAERGIARAGSSLELENARGVALADLQRFDEALEAYRKALAWNPNDSDTNLNLGIALKTLHRIPEARAALDRALVLKPTYTKALQTRVALELEAGDLAAARKYLNPLYESNPGLPEVRQLEAHWHFLTGQNAEASNDEAAAEREYRAGLKFDASHPDLQGALGVLLLVQGRFEEALPPLEAFHRLQPQNAQTALYLGQGYAKAGRFDDARRVLQAGIEAAERDGRAETAEHCREILRRLDAR
ncbi:MAG TPA: FG-GAP-like repeat-containing protein [Opitutaceae bacterium]|nr:FG-GAP-like repeat-containing protein [Opitutaceae bacterium]